MGQETWSHSKFIFGDSAKSAYIKSAIGFGHRTSEKQFPIEIDDPQIIRLYAERELEVEGRVVAQLSRAFSGVELLHSICELRRALQENAVDGFEIALKRR